MPLQRPVLLISALLLAATACSQQPTGRERFAKTFDTHWEKLRDEYPYFELYGVDWQAEREDHRPRAIAAANPSEFAHELARLICSLPDPHVSFIPNIATVVGKWSYPDIPTFTLRRGVFVKEWPAGTAPDIPTKFADDPHAYPEIIGVDGQPFVGVAEILVAGPLGTKFSLRLRWPDGTEQDHILVRPMASNLKQPPKKHYGKGWLVTGRVGSIGYMHVKSFDPKKATLGPDGKMTTMLRAALKRLRDTDGLILDLQGNGGGLVTASDPFLGNLIEKRLQYAWGRSGGKQRIIWPRSPRYRGKVVAIVDHNSASGGEWAARILRDAGRATVIGGRTSGAEAAIHTSTGPDGSVVHFSAWPMVEPNRKPFQEHGIELDHELSLTIDDARRHGYDKALEKVRRQRIAKALELLAAPATALDAVLQLAGR